MIRKLTLATVASLVLASGAALAEGEHVQVIEDFAFSFEGPLGSYDRNQLQRGLQVYTEVCASCHGLQYVAIRNLSDKGGPELPADQVRAYAAAFPVNDEASNQRLLDPATGALRPLIPSDKFPANHAMGAPDLSLMAKARKGFSGPMGLGINQLLQGTGGAEYVASTLTEYTGEEKDEAGSTFYENRAYPTGWIKMPPPLSDGQVTYADGSPNDVRHMAQDVAAFLMWTAEPKMMMRKESGLIAVIFLGIFATLLYLTNKRIWAPYKGKKSNPAA